MEDGKSKLTLSFSSLNRHYTTQAICINPVVLIILMLKWVNHYCDFKGCWLVGGAVLCGSEGDVCEVMCYELYFDTCLWVGEVSRLISVR